MVNYAEDERLSLRTKGLMSVLLFLQNKGESPNVTNAMKHTTGKYPTVRSGIKELTEMGYYAVQRHREDCGFSYSYTLNTDVDESTYVPVTEDEDEG